MRAFGVSRILPMAVAAAALGWGQTPVIDSLDSSLINGSPSGVTGITSGTPVSPNVAGGFRLYVNGAFNVGAFTSLTWRNTLTNVATLFTITNGAVVSGTQVAVVIPPALFQTAVSGPVPVTITVQEGGTNSKPATFTINPPLQASGPALPTGTLNVPYTADLSTGGTSPNAFVTGSLPPGIFPPEIGVTLTGTPAQTGVFSFQASITDVWGYTAQGNDTIEVVDTPTVTSVSPNSSTAGGGTLIVAVTGTNFVAPVTVGQVTQQQIPGSQVQWIAGNGATPLATTFVNGTSLTAIVPAGLLIAPGLFGIRVANPGGSLSTALPFTVIPTLAITTASLPGGASGVGYSATLTGRGGTPPYTWSASGLPRGLTLNPLTGAISGIPSAGTFAITVVLTDAVRSTAIAQFQLVVSPPPLVLTTSDSLPPGQVGVVYGTALAATGGSPPYTFSPGGSLPDGLTLLANGAISGTPKTPGQFSFPAVVTDSAGATSSASFRITIQPAPLNITGGPSGPVPAGAAISFTFAGTGGVPPYRFSPSTGMPPGTTFSGTVLSGTPTTPGTYPFRITIADSAGVVFSRDFTLTVTTPLPPALSLGGSVGNGKAGVPYTGQISAAGGTPPYAYSGSGLPDGLALSASGAITGTPGTPGPFIFAGAVTDSTGTKAGATFPITIAPADLTIVTASLPDGTAGAAYSATLAASGGVKPYTFTVGGLPGGVTATAAGVLSGTPTAAGTFTVTATVKDASAVSASRSYTVTIAPVPLAITTATAPNGTAGTAYAASFAASGGAAPYTFSASGLPGGLAMSPAGAVSGTPTAPGPATIVVTVKDAAGATTSRSFALTIGLPSVPPLNFAGITATGTPLLQPRLQVSLGNPFPVDVVVTLSLTFAPDAGADDPTIQFSGGGRTARITIPAGATNGASDVGVQTGSVAGLITLAAQLQAGGQDVTPAPAPLRTIRIAPAPPVVVTGTLTAARNSTGFTVTLTGYVTDRELTQAVFQFTAAPGSTLQTTTLTLPIDTLFGQYFSGAGATPFGSQFTYTQSFTVTGSTQAVVSVTVTLVNKLGQSTPVTATLN